MDFPNISPEIFSVSVFGFEFALRWYSVSYVAGFFCALILMKYFIRRAHLWHPIKAPMKLEEADSLLTYLILGVIIGGRLGYVIFYNFGYYLSQPSDILRIWDGGMSFHGGFLGVILALYVFCTLHKVPLISAADLIAIATPPGLFFGRVANFINAELWGRPTTVPWGVIFPGENAQNCPSVVGDCARHPSQLYEAGLEGALIFTVLISLAFFGFLRKPGIIFGTFFILYGMSRFFVEYYRVPDQQFFSDANPFGYAVRFGELGLTMGQILSSPMIVIGMFVILISIYREFQKA